MEHGDACGLGVLCADGCRAPQKSCTPLLLAEMNDELEVGRELVGEGADIEAESKVRRGEGVGV